MRTAKPHLVGATISFLSYSLLWALVLLALPIGLGSLERLHRWFFSDHAAPIETLQFVLPRAMVPAAILHIACVLILIWVYRSSHQRSLIFLWYCTLAFVTFTTEFAIRRIPWEFSLTDFFVQLISYQLAALACGVLSVVPWLLVVARWRNQKGVAVADDARHTA